MTYVVRSLPGGLFAAAVAALVALAAMLVANPAQTATSGALQAAGPGRPGPAALSGAQPNSGASEVSPARIRQEGTRTVRLTGQGFAP